MPYAELDGLRLYYERAGSGDRELLFVHGWCCDHTAFAPQFDHFGRAHTVTALDLRGCGRSDRPADGYGVSDLADDLARFCASVGIAKPVVVGHSLGGMIAVELAAQYSSIPLSSFAERLAGPGGEDLRRTYVEDMGARDEGLARWIAELMCAVPLPIATDVIRGIVAWNGTSAFAQCTVPTLLLRATLDEDPEDIQLRSIKPDLEIGITVGAGHFHQLEV